MTMALGGPFSAEDAGLSQNPAEHPDYDRIQLPEAPETCAARLREGGAVAWSEPLTIRTFEPDLPSLYPMYLDHRVYQGSSGKVYPLPFVEGISDQASLRDWKAIHLENEFIRIVVLPELGGRIHVGYDKTTGYDFFYRNNVIKPALVGLDGPWISGGVEFNWPQHHRPATYLPVETTIENGADGSVTVWCHDHDPFARMSAQHGIRLRPGSSVVELAVRLHNRTKERQTFLWWANVAARVHDDYQSFFPEDVAYVADHARRALTSFPEADRPYYGVDYPALAKENPGANRIDWYRNIPVPTSYMIVDSQQDFFGGYDHAAGAGFVHWAERRVSPGKKLWTWGDAPFGHAWDAQLTEADGPYVELMAGVYTDNQPDFTWILPGETKTFTQLWFPIPAIGPVHQATPDAAVHVSRGATITARFAVTQRQEGATLRLLQDGQLLAERVEDVVPGVPAVIEAEGPETTSLVAELLDSHGIVLVRWTPSVRAEEEPWVAEEPPLPEDIVSVEELYLTGVHLSQYRHPTRSPLPYWEAALAKDPGDVRTRLALADREYRAGRYRRAEAHIDTALLRLTRRNANPMDAEAYYLRGLVLQHLGRVDEAEEAFGKAGWDATWSAAAGFALAQSLSKRGRRRAALRVLDSLDNIVGHDSRRAALRAVILRGLGREQEANVVIERALTDDPLDATLRALAGYENGEDAGILVDIALDLRDAGATSEARELLGRAQRLPVTPAGNMRPLICYLDAAILANEGRHDEARARRAETRTMELTWAFPSGLDALDALEEALLVDPNDAVARLLVGMLLYGHGRREEAASHWESAIACGMKEPLLFRNAALAAYNIRHDDGLAWRRYEEAISLAPADARLLYERDQLAVRLGHSAQERLERLRPLEEIVLERDDLAIAYVRLLIEAGESAKALDILSQRPFHPWEGGEGQAIAAWDAAREANGLAPADPPASLGEARAQYVPPVAKHDDGETDYFATSLPEMLLFVREKGDD